MGPLTTGVLGLTCGVGGLTTGGGGTTFYYEVYMSYSTIGTFSFLASSGSYLGFGLGFIDSSDSRGSVT